MGYFRFILALAVSANHFWIIGGVGRFAVFSFYILSGYLMTTVIMDKYGTSANGLCRYALNRILRIYPFYIISFLLTIAALFYFGDIHSSRVIWHISTPSTIKDWIMNLTLFGMDFSYQNRTIPPSWTLFIELCFYAFIPFAVRMGKWFIAAWLLTSICYHIAVFILTNDVMLGWNARYGSVLAGSLGFSMGCFFRTFQFKWATSNRVFYFAIASFTACYLTTSIWFILKPSQLQSNIISSVFFYISMVASAFIICRLFNTKQSTISKLLGEITYPFYIFHITIGYIIIKSTPIKTLSPSLLVTGVFITFIFCLPVLRFDKKINTIRDKVRES